MQRTGRAAPAAEEPHLRHPRAEVHNTALPRRGQWLRFCGVFMSAEWHITRQGKQYGPFTEEKLRELAATKRLAPNDLIWRQGMAQWVAAGAHQSLFSNRSEGDSGIGPVGAPTRVSASDMGTGMPVIDVGAPSRKVSGSRPAAKNTNKRAQTDRLMIAGGVGIVVLALCGIAYKVIQDRREAQYWINEAEQSRAIGEAMQQRLREEGLR